MANRDKARARRPRHRPLLEKVVVLLIIAGVVLSAIGFYVGSIYDENHKLTTKLFSVGLTELGFAFLIAAIVYKLFEESVKRDEAKSIAAFLYGIETDSDYFRVIEDYIIRCPFYRKDVVISYKFLEKRKEAYLIEYTIQYKVMNVSKVRKRFCVAGEVELRPIHHGEKIEWSAGKVGEVTARVRRNDQDSMPELALKECSTPHTLAFSSPEIFLQSRETIDVTIQHFIEKHNHDQDFWQAAMPCAGVTLRLEWPEEWQLRFAHEAFHPDAELMAFEEGKEGATCWRQLLLDQPFMTRHGLRFWWADNAETAARIVAPIPAPNPAP